MTVAVAAGRFSCAEAEAYRHDARAAEDVVRRWGSPFGGGWEQWRPDPSWPVPLLPEHLAAGAGYR